MKKICFIFLILFSCAKVEFPWDSQTLNDVLLDNNKPIMLYFYATW